jgi:putative phosphoesterase
MKVALISDIHGNLVSFEAVLQDIERENVDQIVCLGDVAALGPQPREVLMHLKTLKCPAVMGNTDDFLLTPKTYSGSNEESQKIYEIECWSAAQLTDGDKTFIRTFHPTVELMLGELTLLCFHGSPNSYDDVIRATTPDDELERKLSGFNADIMAGGHTHTQMLRRHRNLLLINPGSIGLPHDYFLGEVYKPARAEYALLNTADDKISIDLRRVKVDSEQVRQSFLGSGMPHAEWMAQDWR